MSGRDAAVSPSPVPGFACWRHARRLSLVSDSFAAAFREQGLLASDGFDRAHADRSGPGGRGATSILTLPDNRRVHLRPLLHGGWLGSLRGGAWCSVRRPIAELRVTASLAAAGAPVPTPVCVLAKRAGFLWRATVGTAFIPDSVDLGLLLGSECDSERLNEVLAAAGRSVRRFHDLGGSHPDLHVGNLLVTSAEPKVVVVDLDRARRLPHASPARRMRELMRLYRSVVKRHGGERMGPRQIAIFWSGYSQGDRELRCAMRDRLPIERARLALHAAFYRKPMPRLSSDAG